MGLGTITICASQYKHVFKIIRIEKKNKAVLTGLNVASRLKTHTFFIH